MNGLDVDVKPWVVIVIKPGPHSETWFFDSYDGEDGALGFIKKNPALLCVVATAIAVFGPRNGVGVDASPKVD